MISEEMILANHLRIRMANWEYRPDDEPIHFRDRNRTWRDNNSIRSRDIHENRGVKRATG